MKKKYTLEYFLKTPEFIRWVRNPDDESSEFWYSFVEQHPDSKQEMAKAAEIIRALKINREYPEEKLKQQVLNNIVAKISSSVLNTPAKGHSRVFPAIWRYAAVLLIALSTIYSFYYLFYIHEAESNDAGLVASDFIKEAPFGQKIQTKLPDGTSVWINSGSRLMYFKDDEHNTRNVVLEGEAFFEVVKDTSQPFIVKTQSISVRALGTSFNVRAYEDASKSEVALLTGKVAVAQLKDTLITLELLPGEKMVIEEGMKEGWQKQAFDYISDFSWKEGILSFEHADFAEVRGKLEKWYGVRIFVSDERFFRGWSVDGKFDNQSLESVLKQLSYTKGFDFQIIGKEIYLKVKEKQ